MEQYNNKNDMLSAARSAITSACEQYVSDKIDEDSFRMVLADIPDELWEDEDTSLGMIAILIEDEKMYDRSLEKKKAFVEFICSFLPTVFWDNKGGDSELRQVYYR